jgi:hypothetical protein
VALLNQFQTIHQLMNNRRLKQLATLAKEDRRFSAETQLMAVAVTATEMQFRSWLHRVFEYIYVLLLVVLRRNAGTVSVGISQISIRHYVSLEGKSQFQSLLLSMSASNNLATCYQIIETEDIKSLYHLCRAYNGKSTRFYRITLERNHALLCQLEARRRYPEL